MEANIYRYLVECVPDLKLVEYEPHLFTEADHFPKGFKYLPDFRCTKYDNSQYYMEVKGIWDARSIQAVTTFKRYRPDLKLVIVDSKEYERIKKKYSHLVKGWEK